MIKKRKTDGMKHHSSLCARLKEGKKPVNSTGKCHQMSETELLQAKKHFPKDKACCTSLL